MDRTLLGTKSSTSVVSKLMELEFQLRLRHHFIPDLAHSKCYPIWKTDWQEIINFFLHEDVIEKMNRYFSWLDESYYFE